MNAPGSPVRSIRFDVDFRYTASFEATLADYNSCQILGTVDLVRDRTRECPSCDRVFCGDFVFSQDNCNPEITRPMAGCFGLTFTTDTSWDVDVYDEAMTTWSDFGSFAEGTTAGTLELTLQDDIVVDVPPFGPVDGGSFVVDFSLTPL